MGGGFPLLDPLFRRPTLVAKVHDGAIRPGERGDDEADPGEEFPEMMLDLGDHPSRPVAGASLILEAAIADPRDVAGLAAGPGVHAQTLHRWTQSLGKLARDVT